MLHLVRRSLLVQLLGVYLLFVTVIIGADLKVNDVAQQQVTSQVQTTDLALAQEIAHETDSKLRTAEKALVKLARLDAVRRGNTGAMESVFDAFRRGRPDVDLVYWLTPDGTLQASVPSNPRTLGTDFSTQDVFRRAEVASGPVIQDGVVDYTTYHSVVVFAYAVRDRTHHLVGILATNLRLNDLSEPLTSVISSQAQQHQHLLISIVDAQGQLIATPQQERLLQPVLDELPGAADALAGHTATRQGSDAQGRPWLYSSVPIAGLGWAVVVQRSTSDALAVITNFRRWIAVAAGLFALGGLFFWLILLRRVVRPLHALARRHATLPPSSSAADTQAPPLTARADEIGGLARSLSRLEHDVVAQLGELHTLLDTSNAVVTSLDPSAVGTTIIHEVRRLVDIQAAAVLVPDDEGMLRVLVSEGREEEYDQAVRIPPDELIFPSALALHDGHPVQMIAGQDESFPARAYAAGFRALLAIPIISARAGNVALVVHRTQPQHFTEHEVDLLLTFANYATLAWEHAVLYERSDERLREVAQENERLYTQAAAEKQTLAAIMRSMNDGLILTGVEGNVLYANPGASAITGLSAATLEGSHIDTIHQSLRTAAKDPATYDRLLAQVRAGEPTTGSTAAGRRQPREPSKGPLRTNADWILETETDGQDRAINLRFFDVRDDSNSTIGRGLLLRDVTREREVDRFKTALLGAVGHELRTPLASIKGYASTLLQDDVEWSAGDERHFLQTISSEADRLAQLVSNLLDLSRIEAGLLQLHRTRWRLQDLVSTAARRLQRLGTGVPAANDRLRTAPVPNLLIDIPSDLPLLDVDRARVEVVLRNLLSNALVYGGDRVHVTAERQDEVVVVRVADNGPGIAAEELPHIFERFYRARLGSERRSTGTGLGLAICKAFVEAHGGAIWAESSEQGTIISFSVPIALPSGEDGQFGDGHVAHTIPAS